MWSRVIEWWENNRATGIGIACLAAALLYGFFFGEGSPLKHAGDDVQSQPDAVALRHILDDAEKRGTAPVATPEEENTRTAAQYEDDAVKDRDHPDAPAKLVAAGNLYLEKLNDPKRAAGCYSLVVSRYPEWEGTPAVYPQLLKAYELASMPMERMKVLMQMTDRFPPESAENQYAQVELGKHP